MAPRSGATSGRRLERRRILLAGAANGIGAALARRARDEGADLFLVDRDPDVERIAAELETGSLVADVTDPAAPGSAVEAAQVALGGLDGLANLAGAHEDGDASDVTPESWHRVLATNLTAPLLWSRAAMPALLDGAPSAIVNVGSVGSTHALPRSVGYVASKTGLVGLTRSVAVDFGRRGVRCNAILPGTIETEFFADYAERNPERAERLLDLNFAGRFGRPEEVAAGCVYLLAEESRFVNGAVLTIDGGRTAAC